jgi:hypothetical protein
VINSNIWGKPMDAADICGCITRFLPCTSHILAAVSCAGVINSNIWGMPMVGADICGFIDATQDGDPWLNENRLPDAEYEQLCNRWDSNA